MDTGKLDFLKQTSNSKFNKHTQSKFNNRFHKSLSNDNRINNSYIMSNLKQHKIISQFGRYAT